MDDDSNKTVTFPTEAIDHDELRERVRGLLDGEGISQATAAKESGVKPPTFSQWMSGSYKGDVNRVAGMVLRWLNRRSAGARIEAVMPVAPAWVEAPTARRIYDALSYAQNAGDIAVIYGGAGLSKTTTIRRYQAKNPNVWAITATPATASVGVMLEDTAIAMGLRDFALHPARLQRAVIKQIEGTRGLLVYDEAQHFTKQALEAARSIHDATGIGLAFAGNASVYNRMYGRGDNGFAQLYSRVGRRVALSRPLAGDVHALGRAFNVAGTAEMKVLEEIAARPGALRMIVKVLRLAAMAAGGDPVQVNEIRGAWKELQGDGFNTIDPVAASGPEAAHA